MDRKSRKVLQFSRETHGPAVNEHIVALFALDSLNFQHTLGEHGSFQFVHEVTAHAHRKAGAHLAADFCVFIHKPIDAGHSVFDFNVGSTEDAGNGLCTHSNACCWGYLNSAKILAFIALA